MEIACLGDSVTAGYGVSPEKSWLALVSKESRAQWRGYGVIGDTLTGMLSRLDCQVLSRNPDIVFLLGGWNDWILCNGIDGCKSAISAMIHHCAASKVVPVVGIPYRIQRLPAVWQCLCHNARDNQDAYIAWLRSLCDAFHLRSVDLDSAFMEDQSLLLDGLHPSEAGHRKIAELLLSSDYFMEKG